MKKKVRIYKQGGEGKFINKTAQFLYKAQEGGTYDPNAMGYPGADQQAQQQAPLNDNQLAAIVVQDISNNIPKEAIVMKLVTAHGKDPLQADQLVDQMYLYLEEESEKEKANAEDDDEYENTDVAPTIEPEVKPDRLNYDDDNDEGLAAAMEDEEIDDDDSEAAMNLIMRYGGLHKSQDGDAVNTELWNTENNQIEFPGIESYMPQSYVDMYGNTNESIAARAWQEPTEEEEVVEDTSYTEPVVDPSTLKKGGTYKTNKRNFVKSILGLVKKQIGGEEETASSSPDPTGQDVRTNNLNSFLGILKNQSKLAIAEEEANQYFDEQQQTPMAQNGIEVGTNFQNLSNRQQRQLGRLYRSIGQDIPGMPPIYNNRAGVQLPQLGGYGVGPITKFDVTRSGIFGNPRRYSMSFGPSTGQGIGAGMGSGVISSTAKVIKSNTVIAANIINSVAIKEVATTTPTTATTTAAAQTANFDLEKGRQADLNPNGVPSGTNTTTTTTVPSGTTIVPGTSLPFVKPVKTIIPKETKPVNTKPVEKAPVEEIPVDNPNITNNAGQKGKSYKELFGEHSPMNADLLYTNLNKNAGYVIKNGKYYISPQFSAGNNGTEWNNWYEVTDPTRIANIKKFKKDQTLLHQSLKGSPYEYERDHLGKWYYNKDDKGTNFVSVTNKESLARLNKEQTFGNNFITLKSQPGYYYRVRNDGSLEKFQGDPKDHNSYTKSIGVLTEKSNPTGIDYIYENGDFDDQNGRLNKLNFKNPKKTTPKNSTTWNVLKAGYKFLNPGFALGFEEGGIINDPQLDQFGNLQRFVYGGDDEEQIDYDNSIDTTDPYFQRGGRVRAGLGNAMRSLGQLLPVNLPSYAGSYNDVSQAYDPSTGQLVNPRILGNELTDYKVTKSGLISGRPKKYTMYFNGAEKPVLPGSGLNSNTNLNRALTLKERNELARDPNISQGKDRWSRKDRSVENRMIRVANRKGIELEPFADPDELISLYKFTDDKEKAIAPIVEYMDSERKPDEVIAEPIPQTSLNEEDYMDQIFRDEGLEQNTASVIKNVVDLKTSIKPEEVNAILDNIDKDDVGQDIDIDTETIEEEPEEDINDFITNNNLSANYQTTMLDNPMYNEPTEELTMDDDAADYYQNSLNVNANGPAPGPMSTVENEPIVTYAQLEEQAFQDSLDDYTNEYNPLRQDFDEQRAQKISDREMENNPMETVSPIDAFSSYYNPYLETLNNQQLVGVPKVAPKVVAKSKPKVVTKNPYPKDSEMYSVWNDLSPTQRANLSNDNSNIEETKNQKIKNYKVIKQDFTKDRQRGDFSRADKKAAVDYYSKYVVPEIEAVESQYAALIGKVENSKSSKASKNEAINNLVKDRELKVQKLNHNFYKQNEYKSIGARFLPYLDKAQAQRFRTWLYKNYPNDAKEANIERVGGRSNELDTIFEKLGPKFLYKWELGGSLNNFLPQAKNGDESPIAYPKPGPEEEEEFDNMLKEFGPPIDDVPIIPKPPEKRDYEVQDLPFSGPVAPYDPRVEDIETYNKRVDKNDPFALDVKVKNQFEVDNEALVQLGNAGVEGVLGAIDKRQNLKRERPMYDNLSADNLYAAKTTKDRGDYVASGSGSGLFRPDEQGQNWNSRSAQYGGQSYQPDYSSIENNIYESTFENGGFYEDDETYMTQEQIDQYLAAGGEIEYI